MISRAINNELSTKPSPRPSPSGIHISDSPRAILPSKSVKVRQTKSELGAVATSPRLNLKRVALVVNQNKCLPLLDCLAGRYRSQFWFCAAVLQGSNVTCTCGQRASGSVKHTTFQLRNRCSCVNYVITLPVGRGR